MTIFACWFEFSLCKSRCQPRKVWRKMHSLLYTAAFRMASIKWKSYCFCVIPYVHIYSHAQDHCQNCLMKRCHGNWTWPLFVRASCLILVTLHADTCQHAYTCRCLQSEMIMQSRPTSMQSTGDKNAAAAESGSSDASPQGLSASGSQPMHFITGVANISYCITS